MRKNYNKYQGGYVALVSVLIAGAAGAAVAVSLILLGLGSSRTSFALQQSGQAKALANACAEEALEQIRDNRRFTGTGSLILGQGSCTYTVWGGGRNKTIRTLGSVGAIARKIEIEAEVLITQINIISWQEVADF